MGYQITMKDALLARLLAAKLNLQLVFRDFPTFATDGKTLFMPEALINTIFVHVGNTTGSEVERDKAFRDVLLGVIAHEAAGHVRMTDFDVKVEGQLPRSILNLLEDIRIEREMPFVFPGSRLLLKQVVKHMADPLFWLPTDHKDPLNNAGFWLMRMLRRDVLDQGDVLSQDKLEKVEKILKKVPSFWKVTQECYALAKEATKTATCTADLVEPAVKIAEMLANAASMTEEEAKQQAKQDQQKGEGDDDQSGQEQGQGQQASQGGDAADEQGAQGQGPAASQGDAGGGNPAQAGLRSAEAQDIFTNVALEQADLSEAILPNASSGVQMEQAQPGHLTGLMESNYPMNGNMTPDEYSRGAKISSLLRSGLREALRDLLEDEDDDDERFGRFNARHAALAIAGVRQDVFTVAGDEAPGLDAHVILMIDRSGSMSKLEPAVRSMNYGIIDALGTIPEIQLDVVYYDVGVIESPRGAMKMKEKAKSYSTGGGTNWETCFDSAFKFLANSRRSRKILFTLTDGDVNMSKEAMFVVKEMGVEAHFLVIGNGHELPDSVKAKCPYQVLSPDTDPWQLSKTVLSMLKSAMNPICA